METTQVYPVLWGDGPAFCVDQRLGICSFFSCFHQNLAKTFKNLQIAYFDQRLECAAPKHWSKRTT